jgi:HlyD family secretion protein
MRPETRYVRTVFCFGLALAAAGCGPSGPAAPEKPEGPAETATVAVVAAQRRSLGRVVEQPGAVHAYEEARLVARVPGHVRLPKEPDGRLTFDIGGKVRGPTAKGAEAGDVLAELVVPELEQETKQKQAMVRQAQAEVTQAQKTLASARASVVVAEAGVTETQALHDRWESESKRMAGLARSRVVEEQASEETLHQFRAAAGRLASARAVVLKAKAEADRAQADVEAAGARVEVAHADAGRAEAMLGYAKIRAPFDGIVTRRRVNTGDFVQPAGGKDEWLFTVARLDPVRIVVAVPEADATLVRDRAPVQLVIPALRGPVHEGTVARTSWDLEPGSRTLRTEIDLPNKEGLLRPGMYVHARIRCGLPEAWVLPASALVKQGDELVCFLIEDGKAVRTPVQVGRSDGPFTEVRGRQRSGRPDWVEFTGKEVVAKQAVGLTDGQAVTTR